MIGGQEVVQKSTSDSILALLYSKGAMSRKDIAGVLNLSRATITVLSSSMLAQGLLIEKGKKAQENGAGRRQVLIDINAGYQYVLSVTLETTQWVVSLCNLKAELIDQKNIALTQSLVIEDMLGLIAHQCKKMLKQCAITLSQLMGIGFSLPGLVNRQGGKSIHGHALWQDELNVRLMMEELMGCPVIIENNIKAFAEGELLYGLGRTADNLLFVKWGPGVGATVVTKGGLYEGSYSRDIDLAHYVVDGKETCCWCGRTGCIEALISTDTLFTKIRALYSSRVTPYLFKASDGNANRLTNNFLHQWLLSLEEHPFDQLDDAIHLQLQQDITYLAMAVINSATILASSHIILLGGMLQNKGIRSSFIQHFKLFNEGFYKGTIEQSALNNQRFYIGCVAIVVRKYFLRLG